MSRYQKGKTNLDFTETRDSEWQWHQLEHMQICTSLQTDNHASTPPLSFLQAGCPSCRPTNSVKATKAPTCRQTGNESIDDEFTNMSSCLTRTTTQYDCCHVHSTQTRLDSAWTDLTWTELDGKVPRSVLPALSVSFLLGLQINRS